MDKISIVILSYNTLEYTRMCINSIRQYTAAGTYEIIVVDNDSKDGSVDWLKKQADLHCIYNKKNVGFPAGCNQGMKLAIGRAILLLNSDTIVTPRWLDNLCTALYSDSKVGAVGCVTNNCSNLQKIEVPYDDIQGIFVFAESYNHTNADQWETKLRLLGFCMLIKREVYEKIGDMDEQFSPGNFEDDDYSFRIWQAGYQLLLCRDTFIHHFGGASFEKVSSLQDKEKKDREYKALLHRNFAYFRAKWGVSENYGSFDMNVMQDLPVSLNRDSRMLVLDCGYGEELGYLAAKYKGVQLYGIAANEAEAAIAQRAGFQVRVCCQFPFDVFPLMAGRYDCIFLHNLPEAMVSQQDFLRKFMHYLTVDGLLYFWFQGKSCLIDQRAQRQQDKRIEQRYQKSPNLLYDLAGKCIQAAEYISRVEKSGEYSQVIKMLETMISAVQSILKGLEQSGYEAVNSKLYCQNLLASAQKIITDIDKNHQRIDFEIRPFCYELQSTMELELHLISLTEFREKREKAVQNIRKLKERHYKYQVAIVVLAYNKLEYTQKAIKSIYQYTDFEKNQVELITVNNGSTDETEAYFAALPHQKKINLTHNIRGTGVSLHVAESKYIVGFSNDVIATPHWLENLLCCIQSDDRIVMVVPTCNQESISNNQGIAVPYRNCFADLPQMRQFAAEYNHSDSTKWEERSLLMPFVSITWNMHDAGIANMDPAYTQIEFCDDDMSTMFRRAGLQQFLAKDTFLHHFGSITLKSEQRHSDSLENMRKVYYDKWGVDAWESRADFPGIEKVLSIPGDSSAVSVLMLEPRFGELFLRIKNFYRRHGCPISDTVALVVDKRYRADAEGMYAHTIVCDALPSGLTELHGQFDLISAGRFLGDLRQAHTIRFLEMLYAHLRPGGMIVLPVMNYTSVGCLLNLLVYGGMPAYDSEAHEFAGCSLDALKQQLAQHPYLHKFQLIMTTKCSPEQAELAKRFVDFIDTQLYRLDTVKKQMLEQYLQSQSGFLKICRESLE